MKKNALARMSEPTETVGSRIRKWNIVPKLLCLLLALVIWLAVVNLNNAHSQESDQSAAAAEQAE
ncbi:MAG: hypothetical protein IKJ35_06315 [Clostridia bacterium]|nr:hypothetical protein [Clostridia bacterium]